MYEAGTKGRQISYKKEAQGFCDLSLEWNHILSMTVKLVLFDVNIFENFGYWSIWNFSKIQQIERAYAIQIIICRRGTAKWSQSDLKISSLEFGDA